MMSVTTNDGTTISAWDAIHKNLNYYHGWMTNGGRRATLLTSAVRDVSDQRIFFVAFAICGDTDNFSRRVGRQIAYNRVIYLFDQITLFPSSRQIKNVKNAFIFNPEKDLVPEEVKNFLDNFACASRTPPLEEARIRSLLISPEEFSDLRNFEYAK